MIIKEGKLYFIKDEFLQRYGEKYNLMDNKLDKGTKRPTYYCFKDNKEEKILWFVPMSKQYNKYYNIYNSKIEQLNKEPNNFVFFNNIAGVKGTFLIQNMFPTTEQYVQEEYLRGGQEIKIPKTIEQEILEKAKKVISLASRGIEATYTNLPEFIEDIKQEINRSIIINEIKYGIESNQLNEQNMDIEIEGLNDTRIDNDEINI